MRHEGATADRAVAVLAARQHGVASFAQLRRAGLSKSAVSRRVGGGRLHRIHRGVYAVGHAGLAIEGRWMAAVLAAGNAALGRVTDDAEVSLATRSVLEHWGAVLSHRSSAALWQLLPPSEGAVDVSISGNGGRKKRRGVHVHRSRTLTPDMATTQRGIPVTTPSRTIEDLRRAAKTTGCPAAIAPWELRRAIRQAEVLGLPTGAEAVTERTRSDLELAFLGLCRGNRLPEPEVNVWVGTLQVDFLWRHRQLVVETDSYRYHRGRLAFENDRERDLRLRGLGYEVIRLSEDLVDEAPGRVAEVLRASLGG